MVVQLTNAEIITYLDNRQAKGFNAILFNAIEHYYSGNTPRYENIDGVNPFNSMTNFADPNDTYWERVDYIVDQANARGIICMINPAYLGFGGGSEGWMAEVTAESGADLQTYGAFLANRYTQGNVIWCLGGDFPGDSTERNKQWNIVTGIRSVRTTDIITAHAGRPEPAYTYWNGFTGWNLNNAYADTGDANGVAALCITEYGRSGPIPFFMIEARYEDDASSTDARIRLQAYHAYLSGACGHFYGHNTVWNFESPDWSFSGTWEAGMDDTCAVQMEYVKDAFDAVDWWKLVPKNDASLVSTGLSSGDSRVCPALASDGSFAMVWIPSSQSVTVVMSNFASSSVRARLFNPTTGAYTDVAGTPFANTGTQSIASGGERLLVMDGIGEESIAFDDSGWSPREARTSPLTVARW